MILAVGIFVVLLATQDRALGQSQAPSRVISSGTPISVVLTHELKTRQVRPGSEILARVALPIRVDDCVAIPEGAPVKVRISEARRAGLLGQADRLGLQAISTVGSDGTPVMLRGIFVLEGENRMVESLASSQVLSCLFFLVPGDRVVLGEGTGWTTFVDTDQPLPPCP